MPTDSVPRGSDAPIEELRAWDRQRRNIDACMSPDGGYLRCHWCLRDDQDLAFHHKFEGGFERRYCTAGCRDADLTLHNWRVKEGEERKATSERLRGKV